MKTLIDIEKLLKDFESKFGLSVVGAEQLSEPWFQMKLGVVSSSNASKAVAKKDSATRLTYMCDLIAEVCTGVIEEMNFKQLEWGKQHEKAARSAYEFASNTTITTVSFIFKDDSFREGTSPDGLLSVPKGTEIKCPWDSANFIKFLLEDTIKPEWKWQQQHAMRVTGADFWDMTMFDPRMKTHPIHTVQFERDEKMQRQMDECIPEFIYDMDKLLARVGVSFGEQWLRLKKQKESA